MATVPVVELRALLLSAKSALGMSDQHLGEAFTASRKTVGRWMTGRARPGDSTVLDIAKRVAAVDVALAEKLAIAAGAGADALGLAKPEPVVSDIAIDAVVCAAADAADATPKAIRPALLAAFTRAQAAGLTVEQVVSGLSGKAPRAKR